MPPPQTSTNGSTLVITNYHVVETQIKAADNAPEITCRFDYARDVAGVADGMAVKLAADGKWLIARSPYDERVERRGGRLLGFRNFAAFQPLSDRAKTSHAS